MIEKLSVEMARKLRGMSQDELAKQIGMSISTYRSKEQGRSQFYWDEIKRISDALKIPIENIT
jgi:transcriptional regulator with XRE-family HTH domain